MHSLIWPYLANESAEKLDESYNYLGFLRLSFGKKVLWFVLIEGQLLFFGFRGCITPL